MGWKDFTKDDNDDDNDDDGDGDDMIVFYWIGLDCLAVGYTILLLLLMLRKGCCSHPPDHDRHDHDHDVMSAAAVSKEIVLTMETARKH